MKNPMELIPIKEFIAVREKDVFSRKVEDEYISEILSDPEMIMSAILDVNEDELSRLPLHERISNSVFINGHAAGFLQKRGLPENGLAQLQRARALWAQNELKKRLLEGDLDVQ